MVRVHCIYKEKLSFSNKKEGKEKNQTKQNRISMHYMFKDSKCKNKKKRKKELIKK